MGGADTFVSRGVGTITMLKDTITIYNALKDTSCGSLRHALKDTITMLSIYVAVWILDD